MALLLLLFHSFTLISFVRVHFVYLSLVGNITLCSICTWWPLGLHIHILIFWPTRSATEVLGSPVSTFCLLSATALSAANFASLSAAAAIAASAAAPNSISLGGHLLQQKLTLSG